MSVNLTRLDAEITVHRARLEELRLLQVCPIITSDPYYCVFEDIENTEAELEECLDARADILSERDDDWIAGAWDGTLSL